MSSPDVHAIFFLTPFFLAQMDNSIGEVQPKISFRPIIADYVHSVFSRSRFINEIKGLARIKSHSEFWISKISSILKFSKNISFFLLISIYFSLNEDFLEMVTIR